MQIGSNNINVGDNSNVTIGITLEQHHEYLQRELKNTKAEMEKAHGAEKQELLQKISVLDSKLIDASSIRKSYEEHIEFLKERVAALEQLKDGGISVGLIEEAKSALLNGDTSKADDLFKQVS